MRVTLSKVEGGCTLKSLIHEAFKKEGFPTPDHWDEDFIIFINKKGKCQASFKNKKIKIDSYYLYNYEGKMDYTVK